MSSHKTNSDIVSGHFSRQSGNYPHSAVHAQGEDLTYLDAFLKDYPQARLLDLGCGGGHVSYTAAKRVREVTAYDLSDAMLEIVRGAAQERGLDNIETCQGKAEHLPFPDEAYDLAATRLSAHHWHDVGKALREVCRVLKPMGRFVVMDIMSPGNPHLAVQLETISTLHDSSHVRNLSAGEWLRELNHAGFRLIEARTHRMRLELQVWLDRIQTPEGLGHAIRALQNKASREAQKYFEIKPDGSFTQDIITIQTERI